MTIKEKLAALREIMDREGLDAYIVSGIDPHNSEYLPEAWQQRKWISGFTGSYGTVVVTQEEAGLWTDTRYFIQAEKELQESGIHMHKLRVPEAVDYPEWLNDTLAPESRVGIDSFCMTVGDIERLNRVFASKQIRVVEKTDLLGEIWLDRPALPEAAVFLLDAKYTGLTTKQKIQSVRDYLKEKKTDALLLSCLDEIVWLYNIRGKDIPYNPVVISYALVSAERAWLFVKPAKIPAEVKQALEEAGVEIRDYHHLFLFLEEWKDKKKFCLDTSTLNFAVYNKIAASHEIITGRSPVVLWKALKNPTEIAGFRKACQQDGIAMTRFFYWLEQQVGKRTISETEAAEKLTALRKENPDYISDSFHTISAYGPNAALPHYSAVPGKDTLLQPKGLYLVDSGAQYWYGTTDITRTVPLGELTALEKEDYTLVLKGMIALSRCIFLQGTSGANIDIVARQPLWDHFRNFGHGTGHGIGHVLCVHEGPQDIRQTWKDQPLLPGMVTSDEPGIYRENFHGVRHENITVCCRLRENEFGIWLGFETLTLCYFDTSALLPELLNEEEKKWLNAYHHSVYKQISPYLCPQEAEWLQKKTKEI